VGDIDFQVIFVAENLAKNQVFWKEKLVEDVVTLGPTAEVFTLVRVIR
jgi:hypothetical protein